MGINFPMFLDLQGTSTWPHFQHEFIDPIIPGLLIPSEYSSKLSLCRAEYYRPGLSLLSSAILWVRKGIPGGNATKSRDSGGTDVGLNMTQFAAVCDTGR